MADEKESAGQHLQQVQSENAETVGRKSARPATWTLLVPDRPEDERQTSLPSAPAPAAPTPAKRRAIRPRAKKSKKEQEAERKHEREAFDFAFSLDAKPIEKGSHDHERAVRAAALLLEYASYEDAIRRELADGISSVLRTAADGVACSTAKLRDFEEKLRALGQSTIY